MEKIFTTKDGVDFYFDEENYTYKCDDIDAVKAALSEDISNFQVDPKGAEMALNLLVVIEDVDRMKMIS